MTTLFVTKCSLCNYDASVLVSGFVALSSQKRWCITPGLPGSNFQWRALYLSSETVCYFIPAHISGLCCRRVIWQIKTPGFPWLRAHTGSAGGLRSKTRSGAKSVCEEPRKRWLRADIRIPPPESVVEQKTSCCAKSVGSFLLQQDIFSQCPDRARVCVSVRFKCTFFHLASQTVASLTSTCFGTGAHINYQLVLNDM